MRNSGNVTLGLTGLVQCLARRLYFSNWIIYNGHWMDNSVSKQCRLRFCSGVTKQLALEETRGQDSATDAHTRIIKWAQCGSLKKVERHIQNLRRDGKDGLSLRVYHALILAQVNVEHGSAHAVELLTSDMLQRGIQPDEAVCHSIIQVLAVHPDYLLRAEVLVYMKQHWMNITPDMYAYIIAGLVREANFEQAMDYLNQMILNRYSVPVWLWKMILYGLLNVGETKLVMCFIRCHNLGGISRAFGYRLLDVASAVYDYETTAYAWNFFVAGQAVWMITPSTGMCGMVLETASRAGDVELSLSVLHILGNRREIIQNYHYEALIDAHINCGDIKGGLDVLEVMESMGLELNASITRGIYKYLIENTDGLSIAVKHLENLWLKGTKVTWAASNVIVEAALYHDRLDIAVEIFKQQCIHEGINEVEEEGEKEAKKSAIWEVLTESGKLSEQLSEDMPEETSLRDGVDILLTGIAHKLTLRASENANTAGLVRVAARVLRRVPQNWYTATTYDRLLRCTLVTSVESKGAWLALCDYACNMVQRGLTPCGDTLGMLLIRLAEEARTREGGVEIVEKLTEGFKKEFVKNRMSEREAAPLVGGGDSEEEDEHDTPFVQAKVEIARIEEKVEAMLS